jgi:proline iminopeptidase
LILCGRHDWICPPEFSEEIAGLVPGSRLMVLENSSHSVRVDAPDVLLREVAGFIRGAT